MSTNEKVDTLKIDGLIVGLIELSNDKDDNIRRSILSSLYEIGKLQPLLVINLCSHYMINNTKINNDAKTLIFHVLCKIVSEKLSDLEEASLIVICKYSFKELTATKEMNECQIAASELLVAISIKFCNEIMTQILEQCQPNILPHYAVVNTISKMVSANVFGMVPFIKVCFGLILPLIESMKQDSYKIITTEAFSNFSVAILDYIANIEHAPDPNVTIDFYSEDFIIVWNLFSTTWISSKDIKLCRNVIEALGQISSIIPVSKLNKSLPKIIPLILTFIKKQQANYQVSKGLNMLLSSACNCEDNTNIETQLDNILNSLLNELAKITNNYEAIKHYNELLRCFTVLVDVFSDKVISFLLLQLSNSNENLKIATLQIIRQLINTSNHIMLANDVAIVSSLQSLIHHPSNKIKRTLVQMIITIASHGYLELEGGKNLIAFIIRQCTLSLEEPSKNSEVTNEMIRQLCEDVLQLLSTTVNQLDKFLWPYLMDLIVSDIYSLAIVPICKSISNISTRIIDEKFNYIQLFEGYDNFPDPQEIFSRLIVMLGYPLIRNRGLEILNLLSSISKIFDMKFENIFKIHIPPLELFLKSENGVNKTWNQNLWEEKVLKLLKSCIIELSNDIWLDNFCIHLTKQIYFYISDVKEKNFYFKCLATSLCLCSNKIIIIETMDSFFNNISYSNNIDKEGCALAVGMLSSTHLDLVIKKLDLLVKTESHIFSAFISHFKDGTKDNEEKIKGTVFLCYGQICLHAPLEQMKLTLDSLIIPFLIKWMKLIKDPNLIENMIQCLNMIGQAMHPNHLKSSIIFTHRLTFLTYLKNLFKTDNSSSYNRFRILLLEAVHTMIKLSPILSSSEVEELTTLIFGKFFTLPFEDIGNSSNQLNQKVLYTETYDIIIELFTTLLIQDLQSTSFFFIFKTLKLHLTSGEENQRLRALKILEKFLMIYANPKYNTRIEPLNLYSYIMSYILCRCCDTSGEVRLAAMDSIIVILTIGQQSIGKHEEEDCKLILSNTRQNLLEFNPDFMFLAIKDLSQVISKRVPTNQILEYIKGLNECLLDSQMHSSSAASVSLNTFFKIRGSELLSLVDIIFDNLCSQILNVINPQTRQSAIQAICSLANHHSTRLLNIIINSQLPYSRLLCDIMYSIGEDEKLCKIVLNELLDILLRCQPYEEIPSSSIHVNSKPICRALHQPLAIVSAIAEICRSYKSRSIVEIYFTNLVASLLLLAACMTTARPPLKENVAKSTKGDTNILPIIPSADTRTNIPLLTVVDSLKLIIERVADSAFKSKLHEHKVFEKLSDSSNFYEGVTLMAMCLCKCKIECLLKFKNYLINTSFSLYSPHRILSTAIFAEFINNGCNNDNLMIDELIHIMFNGMHDLELNVKRFALRGIGNIAVTGEILIDKYCNMSLSAIFSGMDNNNFGDEFITMESIIALEKLVSKFKTSDIEKIIINITIRIRPYFEYDSAIIRKLSFTLFGFICSLKTNDNIKEQLKEQIECNIVTILLHLNDKDFNVKLACYNCLFHSSNVIEHLNQFSWKKYNTDLEYDNFLKDISMHLVNYEKDKLTSIIRTAMSYFKFPDQQIRSNAVLVVGFLICYMYDETENTELMQNIFSEMLNLLKDSEIEVRIKTIKAINLISTKNIVYYH